MTTKQIMAEERIEIEFADPEEAAGFLEAAARRVRKRGRLVLIIEE